MIRLLRLSIIHISPFFVMISLTKEKLLLIPPTTSFLLATYYHLSIHWMLNCLAYVSTPHTSTSLIRSFLFQTIKSPGEIWLFRHLKYLKDLQKEQLTANTKYQITQNFPSNPNNNKLLEQQKLSKNL